jgi:transcriptional antiterminator RfaH
MGMAEQASQLRRSQSGLFADELTAERKWYLLRTRTRQEKVVARELANRHVLHFLPLVKATRYYAGRKALVDLPLFPGYVFLWGVPQ